MNMYANMENIHVNTPCAAKVLLPCFDMLVCVYVLAHTCFNVYRLKGTVTSYTRLDWGVHKKYCLWLLCQVGLRSKDHRKVGHDWSLYS